MTGSEKSGVDLQEEHGVVEPERQFSPAVSALQAVAERARRRSSTPSLRLADALSPRRSSLVDAISPRRSSHPSLRLADAISPRRSSNPSLRLNDARRPSLVSIISPRRAPTPTLLLGRRRASEGMLQVPGLAAGGATPSRPGRSCLAKHLSIRASAKSVQHFQDATCDPILGKDAQSFQAPKLTSLPLHVKQSAQELADLFEGWLRRGEGPSDANFRFCLKSACTVLGHLVSVAEVEDPTVWARAASLRASLQSAKSGQASPIQFLSAEEPCVEEEEASRDTKTDFREALSGLSFGLDSAGDEQIRAMSMRPQLSRSQSQGWFDEVRADLGSRRKSFMLLAKGYTSAVEAKTNRCYIHPESPFRQGWDLCSLMLILSLTILIPLEVCFFWENNSPELVTVVTDVMDYFFLVDIVLNFFTAFHTGAGMDMRLVTDFSGIAKHYAKGWLWTDLVASFPWLQALRLLGLSEGQDSNSSDAMDIVRVLRYAKIARMMKVLRVLKLASLIQMVEEKMVAVQSMTVAFQLLKMTVAMLIISHNVACVWYAVAVFPNEHSTWLKAAGLSEAGEWQKYVAAFYFAITTGTTVGYGDVSPQNSLEQIVTTFVLVLSVAYIGQFLARVSQTVSSLRYREGQLTQAKRDALLFMSKRAVPKDLQFKVTRYIEHVFETDAATALDDKTMSLLSESLKNQLALAVTGHVLKQFPFFADAEESFLTALCQVCRTQRAGVGDTIVAEEQAAYEMFWMVRGEATITRKKRQLATLRSGDWFGELSLFIPGAVRNASVCCETNCELVVLHHDHFLKTIEEFPKVSLRYHRIQAALRCGHPAGGLWTEEESC